MWIKYMFFLTCSLLLHFCWRPCFGICLSVLCHVFADGSYLGYICPCCVTFLPTEPFWARSYRNICFKIENLFDLSEKLTQHKKIHISLTKIKHTIANSSQQVEAAIGHQLNKDEQEYVASQLEQKAVHSISTNQWSDDQKSGHPHLLIKNTKQNNNVMTPST